ncbi:MAG: N-acetyltransferase [Thermoanaerobaculia bacterium]
MIRPYRDSDQEDVLSVWMEASTLAHPFLGNFFHEKELQTIRDVYLPTAETWVWETRGRVVGFVSLLENEIGGLFVLPALHGSGIGRALVDHARVLRGSLDVEVFEKNSIGLAFYARYGFVSIDQKVHEQTGFTLLRLRLPPAS